MAKNKNRQRNQQPQQRSSASESHEQPQSAPAEQPVLHGPSDAGRKNQRRFGHN